MSGTGRRGYAPEDARDFAGPALETLRRGAQELFYLLNRGYPVKGASVFVGNHHLLSERQRIALTRAVSARESLAARLAKRKPPHAAAGETVHVDGFNAVITLEVALSGSPVFRCMDGVYRDLAGLRGTYRLIDKTDGAVRLLARSLRGMSAGRAVFWLDAPVSNSGRLGARIAELAREEGLEADIEVTGGVDRALYGLENVVSGDSVILDRCPSWLNLNEGILPGIPGAWVIDLNVDS